MKYLERHLRKVDAKQYIRRTAVEYDCAELVDCPTTVIDGDGIPLIVYDVGIKCKEMKRAKAGLLGIKYEMSTRGISQRGMACRSKVFGYAPRDGRRRQPCRSVSSHTTDKDSADALAACAVFIEGWYEQKLGKQYSHHKESVKILRDDWRLGGTVFTSGIANYNNALEYHYDSGNFKQCASVMIGFRQHAAGGSLCVPELDMRFAIDDFSVIAFDGQSLIHGVTPIKIRRSGFRATAVYYSLRRMWSCKPIDEELLHHRKKMTELAINPYWKRQGST